MDVLNAPSEKVAVFGEDRRLMGILTTPSGSTRGPHVILLNAGIIHRVGPNRLSVNIARALGAVGTTVLRFDLSGIGDSERPVDVKSLRESVERDIAAAITYLYATHGAPGIVLMGLCSGAFDAFHAARKDPRVVGAVMVDLAGPFQGWRHTLHHLRARVLRPSSWRNPIRKFLRHSRAIFDAGPNDAVGGDALYVLGGRSTPSRPGMEKNLEALLERKTRLYFAFTAGMEHNYNHRSQFRSTFPRIARHPAVLFDFFPKADHAFSDRKERARLVERIVQWMRQEPFVEAT